MSGLDRDRVVAAALSLADAEGLDAVTMRRLGGELGVSAMAAYRHVPNREELVDLLLEAVAAEDDLSDLPSGDWRADLAELARRQRAATLRHPWSVQAPQRPALGPHSLRRLEISLALFDPLDLPLADRVTASRVVLDWARGRVQAELAEDPRRTGVDEEVWQRDVAPRLAAELGTGAFPQFARFVAEVEPPDPEESFELGLDLVLTGVEQWVAGR